ncbi:MAG TPA: hypothetical protein DEP51_02525 [Clostridiales bacterium]|nr:hypothetical protein [Clostridiales bacterium]
MKKIIKISIIVLIILMLAIGGVFAYLYFATDTFRTDKQMFLKYALESKDFIYNQLKDEDLDAYKTKLKNTPYENNGKISISYDTENSNKTDEMKHIENSNISISGKVDKANRINLQNIKVNYPQLKSIDIDLLAQDDIYGFKINNILKSYIVIENNNLQEWAKELGLNEELINLIPNKIDSNFIDSIISEDEVNQLVEKYSKLVINSLNDDMFSKTNQDNNTVYSLKINETQLKNIAKSVLETAKEDEVIWQVIRKVFTSFSIYSEEEVDNKIDELKSELEEYINYYGEDYTTEDYNAEKYTGEDDNTEDYTTEDDIYGNITTDISKEDKIYVYNLYIEDKELIKIESVNDDESQIISKTENGILIEKKEKDYDDQEDITTMTLEKNKEEDKLIYNIEMTNNSEIVCSLDIGYRGLNTLNKVEEVASFNFKSYDELYYGLFQNEEDNNEKFNRREEDYDNIKTPSRKFYYYNTNTFNENLDIKRIENNEMWKMNGKDAKQIGNVFENIATKMEELNKGQIQNNTYNENTASSLSLGLIPLFSIVGMDNIEYEQITVKNVATSYIEVFVGLISARKSIRIFDEVNYPSLEQEMNRIENSR